MPQSSRAKQLYATVLGILDWRSARAPKKAAANAGKEGANGRARPFPGRAAGAGTLAVRHHRAGANYADHAAEMARRMNRPSTQIRTRSVSRPVIHQGTRSRPIPAPQ
jgi:hypothetical protein